MMNRDKMGSTTDTTRKGILIVDDSPIMIMILEALINQQPDMMVVGIASHGEEAIDKAALLKPDLITMDIQMPGMDGLEAIQRIMALAPTPIVVVSSHVSDTSQQIPFRAIENGAVAVVGKPQIKESKKAQNDRNTLIETIRAMAEIKVVGRKSREQTTKQTPFPLRTEPPLFTPDPELSTEKNFIYSPKKKQLIALASSTGGPQALKTIFSSLSRLTVPLVITQHMSPGFIRGLASWLTDNTSLTVKIAESQEFLKPGVAYLAPDDYHLTIKKERNQLRAHLTKEAPFMGFRPSATPLFQSIAKEIPGEAVGGILTGMGQDGAEGLLAMKQQKCPTFVQDEKSAIIFGMPKAALDIQAADQTLPLESIATHILMHAPPDLQKKSH
ncbi:chemotaxis-specific protein-glutamate methyltransferase CheB [Magnetococcales bacterium HHB-1]